MNLGELRSLTRLWLNEPVAVLWSDADLNRLINIGRLKTHNLIKNLSQMHFTTRATFSAVAAQSYYGLPANCKDLKLLTRITGGIETPMAYAQWPDPTVFSPQLDSNTGGLESLVYWMVGRSIRILPPPAQGGAVIISGGGGGAGGTAIRMTKYQLLTFSSRRIFVYRPLGPSGTPSVPVTVVSAGPSYRMYYEARDVNLIADTDVPSFDTDYHDMAALWAAIIARPKNSESADDLKEIWQVRNGDLVMDLLHHLPYPQQEVDAYGSNIF